jgi:DNA sulfur modification protein DndD
MLLKKVKYHNFRPFYDYQEINLLPSEENPDANVTVILGENTFGKSTFVLSFIWCLYGESRFNNPKDILNRRVKSEMKYGESETAYVEIEFEDDNKPYVIRRTQKFTKGSNDALNANDNEARMSYTTESGETKPIGPYQTDINLAIKAILPNELSSFFFFEAVSSFSFFISNMIDITSLPFISSSL